MTFLCYSMILKLQELIINRLTYEFIVIYLINVSYCTYQDYN